MVITSLDQLTAPASPAGDNPLVDPTNTPRPEPTQPAGSSLPPAQQVPGYIAPFDRPSVIGGAASGFVEGLGQGLSDTLGPTSPPAMLAKRALVSILRTGARTLGGTSTGMGAGGVMELDGGDVRETLDRMHAYEAAQAAEGQAPSRVQRRLQRYLETMNQLPMADAQEPGFREQLYQQTAERINNFTNNLGGETPWVEQIQADNAEGWGVDAEAWGDPLGFANNILNIIERSLEYTADNAGLLIELGITRRIGGAMPALSRGQRVKNITATGYATMASVEAGSFLEDVIAQGYDPELAAQIAPTYGALSGAVEYLQQLAYLSGAGGARGGFAQEKALLEKLAHTPLGIRMLKELREIGINGFEEAGQGGIQYMLTKRLADMHYELTGERIEPTDPELWENFLAGAAVGGTMRVGGAIRSSAQGGPGGELELLERRDIIERNLPDDLREIAARQYEQRGDLERAAALRNVQTGPQEVTDEHMEAMHTEASRVLKNLRLQGKAGVEVVPNRDELPPDLRASLDDSDVRAGGGSGAPQAFYDVESGTTYILADQAGVDEVGRLVLHEVAGHRGIRAALGADMDTVLDRIVETASPEVREQVDQLAVAYGLDMSTEQGRREAADEFLAHVEEERDTRPGLFQRVVSAIRDVMRQSDRLPTPEFSLRDAEVLLARGAAAVPTVDVTGTGETGTRAARQPAELFDFAEQRWTTEDAARLGQEWEGDTQPLLDQAAVFDEQAAALREQAETSTDVAVLQQAIEVGQRAALLREMADVATQGATELDTREVRAARKSDALHKMQIERMQRVLGRGRLTAKERKTIEAAAERGVDIDKLATKVRDTKARFPAKDGWDASRLELNKIKGTKANPRPEFKIIPYSFHIPPGKDRAPPKRDPKHVTRIANKVVKETQAIAERADQGDHNAAVMLRQLEWYSGVTQRLREYFGAAGDTFADLLGAFSPRENVKKNFVNAVEAMRQFSRGVYDDLLIEFNDHLEQGGTVKTWEDSGNPVIKSEAGKRFGINSAAGQLALLNLWRMREKGMSPKARNFTMNLVGLSNRATIDMWAARQLQRLAGKKRVPTVAEGGVGGGFTADLETTIGPFGFGQEVFAEAAAKLRESGDPRFANVQPKDLQALAWFSEKEIWAKNNWGSVQGEGGSFELEFDAREFRRIMAGLSLQQGKNLPDADERLAVADRIREELGEQPGTVSFRIAETRSYWGEDFETSYDLESVVAGETDTDAWLRSVAKVAQEYNQDAAMVSRQLHPEDDHTNARPGLTVIFDEGLEFEEAAALMQPHMKGPYSGFTLQRDPRAAADGFAAATLLYMPEFDSQVTAEDVRGRIGNASIDLMAIAEGLEGTKGVRAASLSWYDAVAMWKGAYDDYAQGDVGVAQSGAREPPGFGSPVEQAIRYRDATRQFREPGAGDTGGDTRASRRPAWRGPRELRESDGGEQGARYEHAFREDVVDPDVAPEEASTGEEFAEFFSDVTSGARQQADMSKYKPAIKLTGEAKAFARERDKHRGNFDDHIAASIPGYNEVQSIVGQAIVDTYGEGTDVLDIGASEGALLKAISERSAGQVGGVALDPNPEMRQAFETRSTPPPNVEYAMAAFGPLELAGQEAGWEDGGEQVRFYDPGERRFDVVHEAMVFQFISRNRGSQIAQAKALMKPDGILILEEKVFRPGYKQLEDQKNEYKWNVFTRAQTADKEKELLRNQAEKLEGMQQHMASRDELDWVLGANFKNVVEFWSAGNFVGYVASDSARSIQKFLDNLADTRSEFSPTKTLRTVRTSRKKPTRQVPFASNIVEGLQRAPQEIMTPGQLRAFLRTVRGAEREAAYLGLDAFLAGKKKVTVAEVAAFAAENQAVLEEVTARGGPTFEEPVRTDTGAHLNYYPYSIFGRLGIPPGQREYTEYVLTYPPQVRDHKILGIEPYTFEGQQRFAVTNRAGTFWEPGYETRAAADAALPELQSEWDFTGAWRTAPRSSSYESPHWPGIDNPIAHLRVATSWAQDVESGDWMTVLHVDEIQSDWALDERAGDAKLPFPLPVKWQELAAKHMLRLAAERGAAAVVWSTGDEIKQTYRLGEHAQATRVPLTVSVGYADEDNYFQSSLPTSRGLWDRVGAEANLAIQEVVKQVREAWATQGEAARAVELEFPDPRNDGRRLRVLVEPPMAEPAPEATWPINLYDKQLPSIINKLLKPYGGKVTTMRLDGVSTDRQGAILPDAFRPDHRPPLLFSRPIPPGFKPRKFAERVSEDPRYTRYATPVIQDPRNHYIPQRYDEINDRIDQMSETERRTEFQKLQARQQEASDSNAAALLGLRIMQDELDAGRDPTDIVSQMAQLGTTAGQLLRQYAEFQKATPAGAVDLIERLVKQKKRALTDTQKQELTALADADMKARAALRAAEKTYRQKFDEASAAAVDAAAKDAERASRNFLTRSQSLVPQEIGDSLVMLLQGNLLTPLSQVRNIAGNVTFTPLRVATHHVAAMADSLESFIAHHTPGLKRWVSEDRAIKAYSWGQVAAGARGTGEGLAAAGKQVLTGIPAEATVSGEHIRGFHPLRAWIQSLSGDMPVDPKTGKIPKRDRLAKILLEGMPWSAHAELMFRLLPVGDHPFRLAEQRRAAQEFAELKGLKGTAAAKYAAFPDAKDVRAIEAGAREAVYQQESMLASAINQALHNLDRVPLAPLRWALQVLARMNVPYVTTPANLAWEGLQYASWEMSLSRAAFYAMRGNRREANLSLGKAVVGQMMWSAALFLVSNGLLTGEGEDDQKVRALSFGTVPPNTVNISGLKRKLTGGDPAWRAGDELRDHRSLGFFGIILTIAANYHETALEQERRQMDRGLREGPLTALERAFLKGRFLASATLDLAAMKGTAMLLSAMTDRPGGDERAYQEWTRGMMQATASIPMPNTLDVLNRATQVYLPNMAGDTAGDRFRNVILGKTWGTDKLPLRVDLLGRPIPRTPEGSNPWMYQMFDVTRTRRIPDDKYLREIHDVWQANNEDGDAIPSMPGAGRTLTVRGTEHYLLQEDLYELRTLVGAERRRRMDLLLANDRYQAASPEGKLDALKRLYSQGYETGRDQFVAARGW